VVERAQKGLPLIWASGVMGASNVDAAAAADIIIVAVPFASQEATLSEIAPHVAGKDRGRQPRCRWCRRK